MLYAGFITVTACCPGFVFNPLVLALYALSALFVVTLIRWGIVGQLSASVVQGALSVTLLIVFGPMLPLLPLMLIGHVALPAIFWHWTAMIDDAHR
jgi:hypothetical protein